MNAPFQKVVRCLGALSFVIVSHAYTANETGNVSAFSAPVVVDKWIPAANGNAARGFVQIREGIFLAGGNTNNIGITGSVAGVINLNGGILTLESDLVFSGSSFATTSGQISTTRDGQVMSLNDDQTIADDSTVTLSGNLVIEGNGNRISFTPTSTLVIAVGSEIVFRNLTIEHFGSTRLVMDDAHSKVTLDNCIVIMDDHYSFTQGALKINRNVVFDGDFTLTLSLHSVFIDNNATLHKKRGKIHCSPTSHVPGSQGGNNKIISFGNAASTLKLEDVTFTTSNNSGVILTRGQLVAQGTCIIDNATTDTNKALFLGTGVTPTSEINAGIRPRGDCDLHVRSGSTLTVKNAGIVVHNQGHGSVDVQGRLTTNVGGSILFEDSNSTSDRVLGFDVDVLLGKEGRGGIAATSTLTTVTGFETSGFIRMIDWSPDGQYVAASVFNGPTGIRIYRFTGTTLSLVTNISTPASGQAVAWSPDGRYFAFGSLSGSSPNLQVRAFDGTATAPIVAADDFAADVHWIDWSPDGQYIAVVNDTLSPNIRVYRFTEGTLELVAADTNSGQPVLAVDWSPDGKFLAVGSLTGGTNELRVYRFEGRSIRQVAGFDNTLTIPAMEWSPDGRYIAIGRSASAGNELLMFEFDGTTLTQINTGAESVSQFNAISWDPTGRFFTGCTFNASGAAAELFVLSFNGVTLTPLIEHDVGRTNFAVDWSPNGLFIAGGNEDNASGNEVNVYSVPFIGLSPRAVLGNTTVSLGRNTTLENLKLETS